MPEAWLHAPWPLQACLASGWDVVAPHEASLPLSLGPAERRGEVLTLNRGRTLHKQGKGCRRFYILLEVGMHACSVWAPWQLNGVGGRMT